MIYYIYDICIYATYDIDDIYIYEITYVICHMTYVYIYKYVIIVNDMCYVCIHEIY